MDNFSFAVASKFLVGEFINDLKDGATTFRYFNSRPIDAIENHFTTLLLLDDTDYPVAYGHLEKENNKLWLGIAVADKFTGLGLGHKMMERLIVKAKTTEDAIYLSVDKENVRAQQLYVKFGFQIIEDRGAILLYKLDLN